MIELTFQASRGPIVIQFETPVATPENVAPWTMIVRLNGRPCNIYGVDPVNALEHGARFAASYLHGTDGLDPPVDAPWPPSKKPRKRHGRKAKKGK